jgi:hypothetical protein
MTELTAQDTRQLSFSLLITPVMERILLLYTESLSGCQTKWGALIVQVSRWLAFVLCLGAALFCSGKTDLLAEKIAELVWAMADKEDGSQLLLGDFA